MCLFPSCCPHIPHSFWQLSSHTVWFSPGLKSTLKALKVGCHSSERAGMSQLPVFGAEWPRFSFSMSAGQQIRLWGTCCFQMLTLSIWEQRCQMRSATLLTPLLLPLLGLGISCQELVWNPCGCRKIDSKSAPGWFRRLNVILNPSDSFDVVLAMTEAFSIT